MEYAVKKRRWHPSNARSPIHRRARFWYASETVRLWNTANAVHARMTRKASIGPPSPDYTTWALFLRIPGFPVLVAAVYGYTGADGVPVLQDGLDARGNGGGQGDRPMPRRRCPVVRLRGDTRTYGRSAGGGRRGRNAPPTRRGGGGGGS